MLNVSRRTDSHLASIALFKSDTNNSFYFTQNVIANVRQDVCRIKKG